MFTQNTHLVMIMFIDIRTSQCSLKIHISHDNVYRHTYLTMFTQNTHLIMIIMFIGIQSGYNKVNYIYLTVNETGATVSIFDHHFEESLDSIFYFLAC